MALWRETEEGKEGYRETHMAFLPSLSFREARVISLAGYGIFTVSPLKMKQSEKEKKMMVESRGGCSVELVGSGPVWPARFLYNVSFSSSPSFLFLVLGPGGDLDLFDAVLRCLDSQVLIHITKDERDTRCNTSRRSRG